MEINLRKGDQFGSSMMLAKATILEVNHTLDTLQVSLEAPTGQTTLTTLVLSECVTKFQLGSYHFVHKPVPFETDFWNRLTPST